MMMMIGTAVLGGLAVAAASLASMLLDPGSDISRDQIHAMIRTVHPGSKRRTLQRAYRRFFRRLDKAGPGRVTQLRVYPGGRSKVLAREGQAPQHEGKETTT